MTTMIILLTVTYLGFFGFLVLWHTKREDIMTAKEEKTFLLLSIPFIPILIVINIIRNLFGKD